MAEEVLKPSEWEKTFDWVQQLLGHQIPWYIKSPLGILVFLALTASILLIIFIAISKIKEIWAEKLLPYTYKPEQRQRASNRRLFARYLSREIVIRNISERWRDEEFTDLEAEVEAQGSRRSLLPFFCRGGLHRERSLTRALENSAERLILVEGDPGSGKSVALRHVAYRMSEAAANCRHFDTNLPVFVNLKEIKRYPDKLIDRILIQELVLESLNRINDHFVDEFLSVEFDNGVKNGLFVFFFDSFDEIPEILSSTQTDDVIEKYNSAISDFLGGMNECRGVIASRSYKGPERQGWKTFRVLELSSARQQVLARRALALKPELVPKLLGQLSLAQEDVRAMARNPMLLGLLCEHMRLGNEFPSQATVLLEEANENDAQARLADIIAGNDAPEGMRWPPGILHILGILQVGFGNRAAAIPDIIRTLSAKLLNSAVQHGDLLDRKFALEVAGTAPQNVLLELIRSSLAIDSQWLNDVVYIQMARLSEIPNDIRTWIRGGFCDGH